MSTPTASEHFLQESRVKRVLKIEMILSTDGLILRFEDVILGELATVLTVFFRLMAKERLTYSPFHLYTLCQTYLSSR